MAGLSYWTNRVTLYSLCGDVYVRTAEYEGCFWRRRDSLIYDGGRKQKLRAFTVRIPGKCLIEPGDILALGSCREEVDAEFLTRHAGDAFEVGKVLVGSHTACGGTNAGQGA